MCEASFPVTVVDFNHHSQFELNYVLFYSKINQLNLKVALKSLETVFDEIISKMQVCAAVTVARKSLINGTCTTKRVSNPSPELRQLLASNMP